jgi:hypothetical protein
MNKPREMFEVKIVSGKSVSANGSAQMPVDSQIVYPSYKSFDEFINVAELQRLDEYITQRIKTHIKTEKDDFFLNLHRLDENSPYQPGVREIWLRDETRTCRMIISISTGRMFGN